MRRGDGDDATVEVDADSVCEETPCAAVLSVFALVVVLFELSSDDNATAFVQALVSVGRERAKAGDVEVAGVDGFPFVGLLVEGAATVGDGEGGHAFTVAGLTVFRVFGEVAIDGDGGEAHSVSFQCVVCFSDTYHYISIMSVF